jgi:hypothetical protein
MMVNDGGGLHFQLRGPMSAGAEAAAALAAARLRTLRVDPDCITKHLKETPNQVPNRRAEAEFRKSGSIPRKGTLAAASGRGCHGVFIDDGSVDSGGCLGWACGAV